ncbi:MAG: hypothetical protein IT538_13245 [Variibacter sp.]|nr:hypothetical protein [Variibacter sp.]
MAGAPRLLTIRQFAELHAGVISERLIRESLRRGDLPCVRLGPKRVFIWADALERMERGERGTVSPLRLKHQREATHATA